MAFILLVDPDPVARSALNGILARGNHRFAAVTSATAAWDFIQSQVKVDLLFLELKLEEGNGLDLFQRLKDDNFLKVLPVVIYTEHGDRDTVKRGLGLHVQNFLIKPYRDDVIYAEIAKAVSNPWRHTHFEEEKSFCKMMGYEPAELHKMLERLRDALEGARTTLLKWREIPGALPVGEQLAVLTAEAEAAGAWGAVECLGNLRQKADDNRWEEFAAGLEGLGFAARLIFRHLNPSLTPDGFLSESEVNAEQEAQERARWFNAPAQNCCPVVPWAQLQTQLEALPGCPIMDSVAASFQMNASGHPSSINPLLELVARDPGLAAQMLIAANQTKRADELDPTPIEDPGLAVSRLGEQRLVTQARGLITSPERLMQLPPLFSWPHFWMFQIGTAHVAQFTCRYLDRPSMESQAYVAGLLHDLGKLLLLHLHPFGLQAALQYSREHQVPLREAERLFLGCTTREMAVHFAEKNGLPRPYINVMRWIDTPAQATEDAVLVAVVSLARDLCRHNHVGFSGDTPRDKAPPLAETAEWAILRETVYPSFNLQEFEMKVHADCRELKRELHGRLGKPAAV